MEAAIRAVGCVPWYMPQNGSLAICGPWQTSHFQKMMGRAFSSAHSVSSCLPDCHSVKYSYTLSTARFRRCDQRNLNYSPLCSLQPKFSPPAWQKSVLDIYQAGTGRVPGYIKELDGVEREYYPSLEARRREVMESFTTDQYQQTYNAYDNDIAVLYVYFGQPTTTEYIRVVSLSWVGFLAQAGGLIGACLGFSFISLVELVYWFIIRFFRLSKREKRLEKLELEKVRAEQQNGSFERVWCEGWESPCVKNEKEDDFELESSDHLEYFSEDDTVHDQELGFLSRASSICSIKIRHQLTVLKMFFGRHPDN